jgi:hypothetical protein
MRTLTSELISDASNHNAESLEHRASSLEDTLTKLEQLADSIEPPTSVEFHPGALAARRVQSNLTLKQVAERVQALGHNCAGCQVAGWLNGDHTPNARALAALCEALGMRISDAFRPRPR